MGVLIENIDVKNNLLLFNVNYNKIDKYINFDKYETEIKNIYNFYYIRGYLIPMEQYFNYNNKDSSYVDVYILIKTIFDNNVYKAPTRYVEIFKNAYQNKNIISEIIKCDDINCAIAMEYVAKEFNYFIKNEKMLIRMIKLKTIL